MWGCFLCPPVKNSADRDEARRPDDYLDEKQDRMLGIGWRDRRDHHREGGHERAAAAHEPRAPRSTTRAGRLLSATQNDQREKEVDERDEVDQQLRVEQD